MKTTAPSVETALPELAYGSVWLVSAVAGDTRDVSPMGIHALTTADAVIHDPGIPSAVLELVQPPRYREAAAPGRAIERSIKLARDGWRVVQLVASNAMERAVECAIRCAERNLPFRIAPGAGEPLNRRAPIGLMLVRQPLPVGRRGIGPVIVLMARPSSEVVRDAEPRQAPLSFSMSGLAG